MAFRRGALDQFCSRGRVADSFSKDTEAPGGATPGAAGTGFIASFLCASALHVCGTNAAGKRGHVERVETGGLAGGDFWGHAADGQNILEVRSEDRAKRQQRIGDS